MSDLLQIIKEAPEYVALFVAMGGLGFQQFQIKSLQKQVIDCTTSMTERMRSMEGDMKDMLKDLLGKVDKR